MELVPTSADFKSAAICVIFTLNWFTVIVAALDGNNSDGTFKSASAYCKNKRCMLTLGKLDWKKATAVSTFNDTLSKTGWGILEVSAGFLDGPSEDSNNEDIMFAAGFLEGALTAKRMEEHFVNIYPILLGRANSRRVSNLKTWYREQREWAEAMITAHGGTSALWRQASYLLAQVDGLLAGYQSVRGTGSGTLNSFAINVLQTSGDLLDLVAILDQRSFMDWRQFSPDDAKQYFYSKGHCSALIKVLPGYENLFVSHSTWFTFRSTNRIYKHYRFKVQDPAVATIRMSFSSYPGLLLSLDDFYILGSGMVMLQTTLATFNESSFSEVSVKSLFSWQRVRIANALATSGKEWTDIFAEYNSGTYNCQYIVVDYKKVTLNRPLPDNVLWVAEQSPGLVVAEDLTRILRAGYFATYNVPIFPEIFEKSGFLEFEKRYGNEFSYELSPRAKIFRRDQGKVTDMESMKKLMRSNDFLHDPYSEGNPLSAICGRGDLNERRPSITGCYDTKVTDFFMAQSSQADIISGPTVSSGLPPFSWTGGFQHYSHVGLPTTYNFTFIRAEPHLTL